VATVPNGGASDGDVASELHRSEEGFRLLVESVIDYAIFLLDPSGHVESWNSGAARLKGYTRDEIVGHHYSVFYPPEYRQERLPERLLAEAREQGRVEHSGWRLRKDGSRFWANVVITALHDDAGRHRGFAKVTRDMTEMHETEQAREAALLERQDALDRLEELVRWRRDFTDWIIHDLQTPVTSITAFADLLHDDGLSDAERSELLDRIASNAGTVQHLVDDLRAYTRLSNGQVVLREETIAVRSLVARLLDDMAPVMAGHPVEVDVEGIEIHVDPQAFERVLRNLLANAARHTPAGTPIRVTGRSTGAETVLSVADDGPGIPDHLLPRVFARFQSGGRGGMGLGLTIAKRYVELHGGTIDVDSGPGEGTRFRVTLPGGVDVPDA
jgi:PAS domain S-box-containing protein